MFKLSKSHNLNLLKVYNKVKYIYDDALIFKRRQRREKIFKYLTRISFALVALSVLFAIIISRYLINFYFVHKEAIAGKEAVEKAVSLLEEKNNETAFYYSRIAGINFENSLGYLKEYEKSFWVKNFPFFRAQYDDFVYLLSASRILSQGAEEAAEFGVDFDQVFGKDVNFSELDVERKKEVLKSIYEAGPELHGIKANIDLASENFDRISHIGLLRPFQSEIIDIKNKLYPVSFLLEQSAVLSQILPSLSGYPQKARHLVVFQDNSEINSSGGAFRAYGILETENGEILDFKTYDGDIFNKEVGLWSPDWKKTAEDVRKYYKINYSREPEADGVIAINPEFIHDMLALTGPVVLKDIGYGVDNSIILFSQDGDKGRLGELMKEIENKLFNQKIVNSYSALSALSNSLTKKNILFNFKDENLQAAAAARNWTGEIKQTSGDYLLVVDANMSGLKSDYQISRNINYYLNQSVNGIFADLQVNYADRRQQPEVPYRAYVRIYTPRGSEFISAKGFFQNEVEVSEEENKTVFAGILAIEPGKIGQIRVYYKLPENIIKQVSQGKYLLYAQKQPGKKIDSFQFDFKGEKDVILYNPTGFSTNKKNSQRVSWQTDLLFDRIFTIFF